MNELHDHQGGSDTAVSAEAAEQSLSSLHTQSFPQLLRQLGISVAVTTYQAGRLVLLRADENSLNTHFRMLARPMGLVHQQGRLHVGTAREVLEFHNSRSIASRIEPPGKHDACFLPRKVHHTGDIQIHEMAYAGSELWIMNTRFSCLCTLDSFHSFVPRWQPPFITDLAAEDRCHLNGRAIRDNAPAFVTALGRSNQARGWRQNKRDGGIVLSVPDGEIVAEGLSMPHSPRWHEGQLWVLESGTGSLGVIDPANGRYRPITSLPGFTRGLDFVGRFAFVGLSQVRETAIFSGLPITEQEERSSGVWVVDTDCGEVVAFLRFDASVREIFAVSVLHNIRFPELVVDDQQLLSDAFVLPEVKGRFGVVSNDLSKRMQTVSAP